MANTQAIASSFKTDLLTGFHNFGVGVVRAGTGADTFKAALYLASATLGAATTAYSATGEVSGSGYTAGGVTVTNATPPSLSSTTAIWTPSAQLQWTALTLATAFDTVLIYNSTNSNKAVGVWTFGSQTITAGTLNITMPVNDATHALIQLN